VDLFGATRLAWDLVLVVPAARRVGCFRGFVCGDGGGVVRCIRVDFKSEESSCRGRRFRPTVYGSEGIV
jgi:hypothetical protein